MLHFIYFLKEVCLHAQSIPHYAVQKHIKCIIIPKMKIEILGKTKSN